MRIWHEQLIPKLCRQHLLAVWRESLGCYKIITEGKNGYRNHPATQEFIRSPYRLYERMSLIRNEMLRRGYHPKELPIRPEFLMDVAYKEWEPLSVQIKKLQVKKCECKV